MRSSEEMALVLFRAWTRHEVATGVDVETNVDEAEWDDLSEWMQRGYLAEVNALLEHLFEHGRISSYLNPQMLEELSKEYYEQALWNASSIGPILLRRMSTQEMGQENEVG